MKIGNMFPKYSDRWSTFVIFSMKIVTISCQSTDFKPTAIISPIRSGHSTSKIVIRNTVCYLQLIYFWYTRDAHCLYKHHNHIQNNSTHIPPPLSSKISMATHCSKQLHDDSLYRMILYRRVFMWYYLSDFYTLVCRLTMVTM